MWTETFVAISLFLLVALLLTQRRPVNFPPGPTGIPLLGYLPFLKIPPYEGILELSKKYGKICSIFCGNYPVVVLNDIDVIKEALRDERLAGRPPMRSFKPRCLGKQRGIMFSHGRVWSEQRRFAVKHLREFGFGKGSMEALIQEEVLDLVEYLKLQTGHPINIQSRFNAAFVNTIWHIVSGERYPQDDPKLQKMLKILFEDFEGTEVMGKLFFFPWLTYIFPEWTGWNKVVSTFQSAYDFIQPTIDKHKANLDTDDLKDLIDVYINEILNTTDPVSSFYKSEGDMNLLVVVLDLFLGGAETMSATLGFAILYLITHPEIQKRAQQEIDDQIGRERMPSLSDRQKLPFMEAIMAETLRFSSILPSGGLRSPTEPVEFHGYILPKDTIILPNTWAVHNDPEFWGDPQNFRPERFIEQDGSFQKSDRLIPFSAGKRVCIGEGLARDEFFLFLTTMLQQLEFKINPNEPSPTLEPKQNIVLQPVPYKVLMSVRKVK